ncbi:MAG: Threonine--tRNA ligase [Candidatus Argoarchaeum ethanivorans]|uniref:Threonine--tRNA ligase n=1 Tax=Candidatus Argoarchaeum ethanivorans TaxID=2608793 RepID=A0A811T6S8_9EURY|nr:MAG: Threonine--tRNA ligase [Candidatus Argoarchaeum ethanivorans]
MQLLIIHSDFLEYETKEATPMAEKISDDMRSKRTDEALVTFIAVEKVDEANQSEVVRHSCDEITRVAGEVKASRVVLYPYAHLSPNLSKPDIAVSMLKEMESELKSVFEVLRVPFGWYKGFTIKCKGHPLSELSRTIRHAEDVPVEDVVSEAVKAEEKAKSSWMILTPDGELIEIENFDFTSHDNLKIFADHEINKNRAVDKVPPHVKLMRRLEIADYEPASDPGNMRFYPKGRLIKSLLENYVLDEATRAGAMEVETPLMYDMNQPTLKKYLDRFPARHYSIESDRKKLFLRFAACFGQFLMNHDMTISYRNLPFKMIELTRYSFRKEQRGELAGLRRLRSFTMPDMHTLCTDMGQALEEFYQQYNMSMRMLDTIGLDLNDYEVAVRFTRDFYENNREFITKLAKTVKRPVLVEMWDERFFYFVLKFEFNYIDCLGKASALSTVQIDVENAERYDIDYIDSNGHAARPLILHCSPSGAIERCIYALLEKAQMIADSGALPMLPLWLSPTQVRIIPVADHHIEYAKQVASQLRFRVDIDDRNQSLSKKIRDAGREWVPYVVVVGDSEVKNQNLTVTIRAESDPKKPKKVVMTAVELEQIIDEQNTKNTPYKPLPLNTFLSLRPKFV